MAPLSTPTPSPYLSSSFKRQEACALSCLSSTDHGSCADAACLCASSSWGQSVLTCIQTTCESQPSLDSAYTQLQAYCQAVDVTFTFAEPTYLGSATSTPVATSSGSGTAHRAAVTSAAVASVSAAASSRAESTTHIISGVMAGVCSLLFVIALIIGYLGIKERLRKQARANQSTKPSNWTGGQIASDRTGTELKSGGRMGKRGGRGDVGVHSSVYGADTSQFDTAGYADLELEDRRAQARKLREANVEAIKREHLQGLFVPTLARTDEPFAPFASSSSSSTSHSPAARSTSSFSSKSARKPSPSEPSADEDDDDVEGQYVTLPSLSLGLAAGEQLGTASMYAPQTASSDGAASSHWTGHQRGTESTTALQPSAHQD